MYDVFVGDVLCDDGFIEIGNGCLQCGFMRNDSVDTDDDCY